MLGKDQAMHVPFCRVLWNAGRDVLKKEFANLPTLRNPKEKPSEASTCRHHQQNVCGAIIFAICALENGCGF